MRPAFTSVKAAAAFLLLLSLFFFLPLVLRGSWLSSREQAYCTQSWNMGCYPWIQNQIFEETNPIDIAFLGSSHILAGINTPYVQQELSKKLGRQSVVRTIGWGGSGYDGLYLIANDLLEHRKVKMLVFYDERVEGNKTFRNRSLTSILNFRDQYPLIRGLPLSDQAHFYMVAMVGMPKALLSLIRPWVPAVLRADQPGYIEPEKKETAEAPYYMGATPIMLGYKEFTDLAYTKFVPYHPSIPLNLASGLYSSSTKTLFDFSKEQLPAWHLQFAKHFAAMAKEHNCQPAFLDLPVFNQRRNEVVQLRAYWPEALSVNIPIMGIPPAKLFKGLSDDEIKKLYYDPEHFNKNGQEYFTQIITPTFIEAYENSSNH